MATTTAGSHYNGGDKATYSLQICGEEVNGGLWRRRRVAIGQKCKQLRVKIGGS